MAPNDAMSEQVACEENEHCTEPAVGDPCSSTTRRSRPCCGTRARRRQEIRPPSNGTVPAPTSPTERAGERRGCTQPTPSSTSVRALQRTHPLAEVPFCVSLRTVWLRRYGRSSSLGAGEHDLFEVKVSKVEADACGLDPAFGSIESDRRGSGRSVDHVQHRNVSARHGFMKCLLEQ